jgi:hypothetical protein
VAPTTWPVPGVPLAAWSGPHGASLVVFRSLPIPGGTAAEVAEGLANRLEHLPGLQVMARGTESVAGATAARVEAVAPGTGDALAPSGTGVPRARPGQALVPTRVVVIGIPRQGDTLFLTWHAPESAAESTRREAETMLRGLRLVDRPVAHSSY